MALVGIPHGALDHWIGRELLENALPRFWLPAFLVGYLAVATCVVGGWYMAPTSTACLFFLASAWHFGVEDDEVPAAGIWQQLVSVARGGMIVWVPAATQPVALLEILSAIVPSSFQGSATTAIAISATASIPFSLVLLVDAFRRGASDSTIWRSIVFRVDVCHGEPFDVVCHLLLRLALNTRSLQTAIHASGYFLFVCAAPNAADDHLLRRRFSGLLVLVGHGNVLDSSCTDDIHRLERDRHPSSLVARRCRASSATTKASARVRGTAPKWSGRMRVDSNFDYVIVGGGLQAGLLALALRCRQPHRTVLIVERQSELGGNHTWCCHSTDIPPHAMDWVGPLIQHEWPAYRVQFPKHERVVRRPYRCVPSAHFRQVLQGQAADSESNRFQLLTSTAVATVNSHTVITEEGAEFHGDLIMDCRGPSPTSSSVRGVGYQKFLGLEIELGEDQPVWPDDIPILMDARTEQEDGFRFLYVLPFNRRHLLIEDTCFSDDPNIDEQAFLTRIRHYLESYSISAWRIVRREQGCLPMPFTATWMPQAATPLAGGYLGGWFHAATGYSFPLAVRVAEAVASAPPRDAAQALRELASKHRRRAEFARFLNRLLFRLVRPETRWQIFRRFYQVLSEDAICRFYAHEFTAGDAARIVVGWPPRGLTPIRFFRTPTSMPCLSTAS